LLALDRQYPYKERGIIIIAKAQSNCAVMVTLKINHQFARSNSMSKEQKSIKAAKKKPAMTPKEKKAAKKVKKESKDIFDHNKTR